MGFRGGVVGVLLVAACMGGVGRTEPIRPIPVKVEVDERKVALGRSLFHDTLLSRNGEVSCASCHDLGSGGDDGRPISIGIDGKEGALNVSGQCEA